MLSCLREVLNFVFKSGVSLLYVYSARDNNMTLVTACTFIYSPPVDGPLSKVRNVVVAHEGLFPYLVYMCIL